MIHPTAIVDPSAKIAEGVSIGPYSVVGPDVEIGPGSSLGPHVVIQGPARLGADNTILQFASLGAAPQDLKYKGEATSLEIGDRNTVREFVTLNRGTVKGGGITKIGSDNLFMAYAHVAHDCVIGDHVVMANAATLAGHVLVEDHAILGGLSAVHQFARVGEHAILGGGTMASLDIPPYVLAAGNHASLHGINVRGLERRDFSADDIRHLKRAYRLLLRECLPPEEALTLLSEDELASVHVQRLLQFMETSERGVTRGDRTS